jgi:hypothetical protein
MAGITGKLAITRVPRIAQILIESSIEKGEGQTRDSTVSGRCHEYDYDCGERVIKRLLS